MSIASVSYNITYLDKVYIYDQCEIQNTYDRSSCQYKIEPVGSMCVYTYIYICKCILYDKVYSIYGRDVYDVYIVERYVFIYLHAYAQYVYNIQ